MLNDSLRKEIGLLYPQSKDAMLILKHFEEDISDNKLVFLLLKQNKDLVLKEAKNLEKLENE